MKTTIEAGHYYSAYGPSQLSMVGWQIGKQLATQHDGSLVLFVDDYHQEQEFLEPGDEFLSAEDAAVALAYMKSDAEHMFYEAALAESAPLRAAQFLEDGLVKLKKGVVSAGGVRLGCLRRRFDRFIEPNMCVLGLFAA